VGTNKFLNKRKKKSLKGSFLKFCLKTNHNIQLLQSNDNLNTTLSNINDAELLFQQDKLNRTYPSNNAFFSIFAQ